MAEAFRPAPARRLGLIQQCLQFQHDLRLLEVQVLRFAGVGFEVVKLARCPGRSVGKGKQPETGGLVVEVPAGACVVEILPVAPADGEIARPAEGLLEQIGPDRTAVLAEKGGKQVERLMLCTT